MPRNLKPRSALSSPKPENQKNRIRPEKRMTPEQEILCEISKVVSLYERRTRDAMEIYNNPLGNPDIKIENKQDTNLKLCVETGTNSGWEFTSRYHHHARELGYDAVNDPEFWDISEYPEPDENEDTLN